MEIRIGIVNSPRELSFESSQSSKDIEKLVADSLGSDARFVTFADSKGNSYVVPTVSLAYIEIGTEESRRVGFVA